MPPEISLTLRLDNRPAMQALSALAQFANLRSDAVQAFLSVDGYLCELVNVDGDAGTATAGEVWLRLQPTERFRVFLAAMAAGDGKGA